MPLGSGASAEKKCPYPRPHRGRQWAWPRRRSRTKAKRTENRSGPRGAPRLVHRRLLTAPDLVNWETLVDGRGSPAQGPSPGHGASRAPRTDRPSSGTGTKERARSRRFLVPTARPLSVRRPRDRPGPDAAGGRDLWVARAGSDGEVRTGPRGTRGLLRAYATVVLGSRVVPLPGLPSCRAQR